jgi:hypothetical protein
MRCDRDEVLTRFLKNAELRKRSGIPQGELEQVSFSQDSKNVLIESLKAMIYTYCGGDANPTIQRSIQTKIKKYVPHR